ncbi:MAG TPA: hypothetical protein VJ957_03840 [Longimicrobiales bacterium]|nr:hypothetical protein [Longimicrobiales bacterium]
MSFMEGDPRTRFITHKGVSILLLDYSGIADTDTALKEIARSRRIIAQQPRGSLRTLTYVEGAHYDTRVVQALKDLTTHNAPFVKAAAVVGLNALRRVIYRAVITFSRRDIRVFADLDTAKDWLAGQS